MSKNEAEYKQISRLLTSGNTTLDKDKINEALREHGITKLAKANEIFLITDPSDIRKEHSLLTEDLGKVRSLSGGIINGFSTLNTVALDLNDKNLTLLETKVYSNRERSYVTEEELEQQAKPLPDTVSDEDRLRYDEVKNLVVDDAYININKLLQLQLKELSDGLKSTQPGKILTHVLDREFDSVRTLDFINNELVDKFVVRIKTSRITPLLTKTVPGKACNLFKVTAEELKKIDQHADINYTIINGNICYDNKLSRLNPVGKVFDCEGDIADFLKCKGYKKNNKLTNALSEIKDPDTELQAGELFDNWYKAHTEKEVNLKLIEEAFPFSKSFFYLQMPIKNKTYHNVKVIVSWGIKLNEYQVVKVQIQDKNGINIFKQPMLLVTNKTVETEEQALSIYHIYLKRAKIEGVFKFLKGVLGWEDSQLRQLNAIKNLLTFCYFVAGYFYEIESTLTQLPTIQSIAALGGGKGKVTRHFILEGFAILATKVIADNFILENNISPEELKEMYKYAGILG